MRFLKCEFCEDGMHLTWDEAAKCRRRYFVNERARKAAERAAVKLAKELGLRGGG